MTTILRRLRNNPQLRQYLSVRLLIGLGLSIACIWIFAELAEEFGEGEFLTQFDEALANALYEMATPQSTAAFEFISLFGSQIVFVLTVMVALYYAWRRLWVYLTVWLLALAIGELLNLVLKDLFARARPVFSIPLVEEINYSFPSGHAMMSMIAYGMLAYFLMLAITNLRVRIVIVFAAALVVVLIGISRMYLGVHFFSDVIAGFAAGGVWLVTCIGAMNVLQRLAARRVQNSA